jgi:hypothetical protein
MTSLMLGLLVVLTLFLAAAVCGKVERDAFNVRFPPITEAEFVARCRPGVNPDVALRVRRIVAEQLGVDYERVYPSSRFVEDLGPG